MVKINTLELENIKRIKAVVLTPAENGLTVIGGNNNQGKSSVLDAIAWTLGGDKFKPSQPMREGSLIPPHSKITLSNGLIVERGGEKGSLKVIDPKGNKGGQTLLNSFIEQMALDLPKFMAQSGKEKANTLLKIIGVGDKLYALENEEQRLYNQRHAIGQIADQKMKFAKEMPFYPDAPKALVSASELIAKQQMILAKNGENMRKRQNLERYEREYKQLSEEIERLTSRLYEVTSNLETARKSAENLIDESTAELEQNIAEIEKINIKVHANFDREKAESEAEYYNNQYSEYTDEIERIRQEKIDLLNGADLPLDGLSVENGELIYNGCKWDCMSGSEQLKVSAAIVRRLNPECGFVLLDKLEQMDMKTLAEFGEWLEKEGLQAIATRVSTGGECEIIIEDGYSVQAQKNKTKTEWKASVF